MGIRGHENSPHTATKPAPTTFEDWATKAAYDRKKYGEPEAISLEEAFNAGRASMRDEAVEVCNELADRSWDFSLTYAAEKIRALMIARTQSPERLSTSHHRELIE